MWRRSVLYVLALLLTALSAIELIVLGGTGLVYPGGYPDPFAPYEAMMPGQTIGSSALSLCLFDNMLLVRDMTGYCQLHSDNDALLVTIMVQFDVVQRLSFRGGHFQFGDLVKRWGRPTVIETFATESQAVIFHTRWSSGIYAILTPAEPDGRLNYLAPVHYLSIEGEQPSLSRSA